LRRVAGDLLVRLGGVLFGGDVSEEALLLAHGKRKRRKLHAPRSRGGGRCFRHAGPRRQALAGGGGTGAAQRRW
jgi:hypothetical protein